MAAGGMELALIWMEHRANRGMRKWLERESEPDHEELEGFLLRGDLPGPWELSQGNWGPHPTAGCLGRLQPCGVSSQKAWRGALTPLLSSSHFRVKEEVLGMG